MARVAGDCEFQKTLVIGVAIVLETSANRINYVGDIAKPLCHQVDNLRVDAGMVLRQLRSAKHITVLPDHLAAEQHGDLTVLA